MSNQKLTPFWEAILAGLLLFVLSWTSVRIGIAIGEKVYPADFGYPLSGDVQDNLFRFDSKYYKSIADSGYFYNGDPGSSPNLAFAPLFPLLSRFVAAITGLGLVEAGFALNKVLLGFSFAVYFQVLKVWTSRSRALMVLFALGTSAGSYAFHAYYSESTMLLFTGLALLLFQQNQLLGTAFSVGMLGASRLAALPMVLVFSLLIGAKACQASANGRIKSGAYAVLCLAGSAAYLSYIAIEFGNPFVLLDKIQKTSWGIFHHDVDWAMLLSGKYLINYWSSTIARGLQGMDVVPTLNLVWMSAGLLSAVYLACAWRRHVLTYVFVPYILFVYYANSSSEYLISTHRLFSAIPVIFLMFSAIPSWLWHRRLQVAAVVAAIGLTAVNLCYGWLHTARFNQGSWFWF